MSKAPGITLAVLTAGLVMALGLFLTWIGSSPLEPVAPTGRQVHQAEAHRRGEEAVIRDIELTAAPATLELDGSTVSTWAFNGQVPGPVRPSPPARLCARPR